MTLLRFLASHRGRQVSRIVGLQNTFASHRTRTTPHVICLCDGHTQYKISQRGLFLTARSQKSQKTFEKSYPEDDVDQSNHLLIYASTLAKQLQWYYMGLTATIVGANCAAAWNIYSMGLPNGQLSDPDNPYTQMAALWGLGTAIWTVTVRLVQASVIRVYYNDANDSYTAVTRNLLLRNTKINFNKDDIRWKKPGLAGNYYINNIPVHLNEKEFKSSIHFKELLQGASERRPPKD